MHFALPWRRPDPRRPKFLFFFFFKLSSSAGGKRHLATVSKTWEQRFPLLCGSCTEDPSGCSRGGSCVGVSSRAGRRSCQPSSGELRESGWWRGWGLGWGLGKWQSRKPAGLPTSRAVFAGREENWQPKPWEVSSREWEDERLQMEQK